MLLIPTVLLSLSVHVSCGCFDPSPAFPVPSWEQGSKRLATTLDGISRTLSRIAADEKYDTSSFSVAITSNTDTLWTNFHTARKHDAKRPGDTHVDGNSQYRIASITKTFTVLGVLYQHAAGNLSLDDPVSEYIEELTGPDSGDIPWKDITIRALASQLSGIPREMGQADVINELPDPTVVGLPPVSKKGLPECYQYNSYKPCDRKDLLDAMKTKHPVFAPNQQSTYSNVNYELLGLVLENVTGLAYEEHMKQAIFEPLQMSSTSLDKPSDEHAVLPIGQFFWDVNEGVHNPTGGIYSSSKDMSKYVRYILTHYNALATGVNWLFPASWSAGLQNFYGMPFEIFRTDALLEDSKRPITFTTKGGAVPAYYSRISIMPEYGLGLTILTGGDSSLVNKIQEAVTVPLLRAAESLIWQDIDHYCSGTYTALDPHLNSTLTLAVHPSTGLTINSFISNSTDVFSTLLPSLAGVVEGEPWHAQLVPTLLFKNETSQQGEIWRILFVPERTGKEGVWGEACNTDVDLATYAGLPINEVVFWQENGVPVVELPAWRVKLRQEGGKDGLVQQS